jgi:hypothetical protein
MWILNFLPDSFIVFVVNSILLVGVASFVIVFFGINQLLRWFPSVASYYLVLQLGSALFFALGLYLKGGLSTESEWREKLRIAEEKARAAEVQAEEANDKIKIKIVNKIKEVRIVEEKIREVIVEKEKTINANCTVAPEVVELHNNAARNQLTGNK